MACYGPHALRIRIYGTFLMNFLAYPMGLAQYYQKNSYFFVSTSKSVVEKKENKRKGKAVAKLFEFTRKRNNWGLSRILN